MTTAALLFAGGCTGGDSTTPATFTAVYSMLFPRATKSQCDFCHGLPPNQLSNGRLSMGMDQATAYAALVGQSSTSDACGPMSLVVPGDPAASLMMLKLTSTPPCGEQMPLGGDPLSAAQLGVVRGWILDGAPDD